MTTEGTLAQVVFSAVASPAETDVADADRVPIASVGMRFMIIGASNPEQFLHSGRQGIRLVIDLLARRG
jgi:hypothetical protein